ncbi:hypothetical protein CFC21_036942 [Triticum aestivum]|uniref:At1g61320/AtMIF1 LRR domain-containing protein n=3 Tax=Triticum TaxID=4564 RepID=A0A9R0RSZ8_TRITD|nr:uncharacterized protein LOC123062603 isoform X1 [Triticum aestivum]KAF7024625.1 hypothetical protein CFC21_036942 [Triticum aestivum]VAH66218.1 unnamed protein product [Triticum turgidum subsp. durum]
MPCLVDTRSKISLGVGDELVTSVPDKKDSLCQQDDQSQGDDTPTSSGPDLPEDIWCLVHSLMPLCDSAHSACVSRTFLRSWRCHPKLIFTEETLGLKRTEARDFTSRVNQILKNHSDTSVKILEFVFDDCNNVNTCHLNSWLQKAVTPGIEKITLFLPWRYREEYNFPCSILLDGRGNSICYLDLTNCAFHPMVGFDCLRSLTKLRLYGVCITGDELGHLISNCFALEELQVWCCMELICLTIPFWLQRLSCLTVSECNMLRVIESTAPNFTTLDFFGEPVQLVLRESSKVKHLKVGYSYKPNAVSYAITKLPSIAPHLQTLAIYSSSETVNTPMVADKFLDIKHLNIHLGEDDDDAVTPTYDYLSLASFLDACPVLESFTLSVDQSDMQHESVFGDPSLFLRQILQHEHERLKKVQIIGFCSAKSMVELTCDILKNATSLESLTLDCIFGAGTGAISDSVRCGPSKSGKCWIRSRAMILEAHKAVGAIKRYILERVPPAVKLNVGGPCSRCQAMNVMLP